MSETVYKPTKKLEEMAIEWGRTSGGWCNFAEQVGINKETAEKYYGKFWRKGKNDVIMSLARQQLDAIETGLQDARDVPETMQVVKAIDNFLSKRSSEWSTKQQIEQTNVNIEAPVVDYSKLSEKDKDILKEITLKAKG